MFATSGTPASSHLDLAFFEFLAQDTDMVDFLCDVDPLGNSSSISLSSIALSLSLEAHTFEILRFLRA
jgi:hypothetical protein